MTDQPTNNPQLTETNPQAGVTPPVPPAPPVPAPQVAQPPVTEPKPAHPTTLVDERGEPITSDKLKERIERAKEQERLAVLSKLGFKSIEEAEEAAKKRAEEEAKAEEQRKATLTREQQLSEELEKEKTRRAEIERKAKETEAALERKRVEEEIQRAAVQSGVRQEDADYALYEYSKAIKKMKEDDPYLLDPGSWFSGVLKKKKPHVFAGAAQGGEQPPPPATTGLQGGDNNGPPPPAQSGAGQGDKDAFKMSKKEWIEHLRSLGASV